MNWWEEAEAKALRARTPVQTGLVLWQRLQAVGIDADLAFVAAHDLACLLDLCGDFVKLVDSLLTCADGDRQAIRRHGLALSHWARRAEAWTLDTAPAFNQLVDSLDLDPELLTAREEAGEAAPLSRPEEQPKVDGRYQYWHLLYERLDLKLGSIGLEERVQRALARELARVYEQSLLTFRQITQLEKETPRFRTVSQTLLDINTAWHFDLGPYHLGCGRLRPRGMAMPGLQTWLLLAFG
jgi:hypothetical protein